MFQPRTCFGALVLFAALLSAPVGSAAQEQPSGKAPLNVYTSQSCNESGVNYAYYEGNWGNLPDFKKVKPVKEGKLGRIDLSGRKRDEHFALKFTGYLKVRSAGTFQFFLESDEQSRLVIDSKTVVDVGKKRGVINLAEGVHTVILTYHQGTGDRRLDIAYRTPFTWDVKEADIRIPVRVLLENAWGRMPPQAYLADLNPIETKDLSFDPKTKSAVLRDIRSPEDKAKIIAALKERCRKNNQKWKPEFYRLHGNPIMKVRGSSTYSLKPEYKWFSYWARPKAEVHIDGKGAPGVLGQQEGVNPGDPRFPTVKQARATIVPIPPNGKKLTIKADAKWIRQAGFVTRSPAVARVSFYLSSHDPTALIPLVYDTFGKRVGCRILWAHPGELMSILFDCSSGERQYWVYLVDRSKNPARLNWVPKAGLIFECRYLNRYDPAVRTVDGFLKLWDSADLIAGKKEMTRIWKVFFPFRPFFGTTPNYRNVLRGARMELSSYTGYFHVPDTQKYQFHYKAKPGGYFLIDNQLVSQFKYHEAEELQQKGSREGYKRFAVELEKGIHRMEFCQYGSAGRFATQLGWGLPGKETDLEPFGNNEHAATFSVWEPIADATADMIGRREKKLLASFTWQHQHQCWGRYPASDIICLSFTARLTEKREGAVFRWRFSDGHTAEGQTVKHHFLSSGMKKVRLDVLDKPDGKVIASASGRAHAHINWSWPQDADRSHVVVPHGGGKPGCRDLIAQRGEEFASVTPIEEVVSIYYWARQNQWPKLRGVAGSALSKRAADVIAKYPYTRLLEMAQFMGAPGEPHSDAAERFLEAAMIRAPAGGRHWRSAALALADILISARAEPEKGFKLLEKLQKTKPTFDMTENWQTAEAKQWHSLTATDNIAGAPGGLNWSNTTLPLEVNAGEGRGMWLAKDINLPASRKGKELVLELGNMPGSGVIYFNGKRVGRPWQWPDGSIVIPAAVQRAGGKNRFEALFQPVDPPGYFAQTPAPAFSGDLKRLAWASRDNTIKLRDTGTGKDLLTLKGHSLEATAIAFSTDGRRLASASSDKTIKLWDTGNGNELLTLKGHSRGVLSIAFSRDSMRLASGSYDKTVKLWDTGSGQELLTLKGHSSEVLSIAFTPDGKRLASAGDDKTIKLWDTVTGNELLTLKGHSGRVNSIAFSPDGKRLASAGDDNTIKIWDAATGKELRSLGGHSRGVLSIAFSPNGKRLASGSQDLHIRLWDVEGGNAAHARQVHKSDVLTVAYSADGKTLASASRDIIKIWNAENAGELRSLKGHGGRSLSVALKVSGPRKEPAKGFTFPMVFYTSKACNEQGVNYAYYEGKWEKLPDFDKLKPVKTGNLKHVDLSPRKRDEYFGMRFTGYVKVLSTGVYKFSVKSDNGSRLRIGPKTVIDNDGNESYDTSGEIRLAKGVHPVTLTFFQSHAASSLSITLPQTSIPAAKVATTRITADALLGMGKNDKAKAMLLNLKPNAWPIPEKTRLKLTSDLRRTDSPGPLTDTDAAAALDTVNSWLRRHPMLRMDPEFMSAKIEAYVEMGDYARAFTLAAQMRRVDMNEHQRRQLMLVQVKSRIKAGQMDVAREIYGEMKKIAPYSTATVEAREAIKEAVLKD